MTANLVWLPQAITDVRGIYVQIGLEQPQAAERFLTDLNAKLNFWATSRDQSRPGLIPMPTRAPSTRFV